MARIGELESLLGGLETQARRVLIQVMRALAPNLRFGPVDHRTKAENFSQYFVVSTTAASTGEFSIEHGMGRTPYLAHPILDLTDSNARLVPLDVTRAADSHRVYVKSSLTNARFGLLLE